MLKSVIIAFACSVSFVAYALADSPKPVNVPAGDLVQGLETLAKQADVELVYQAAQLKGLRTRGVTGSFTSHDAVTKLLEGTKLRLSTDATTGAMLIAPPDQAAPGTSPATPSSGNPSDTTATGKEGKKDSSDQFRVAQLDQGQTSSPSTVEKPDEQASKKKADYLEEVIVTGSRIPILAGQQSVQPVRSYTREDIENSGQTTMGEFLNTLPDVSTITNGPSQTGFAGTESVQLHGLPVGTTLTLLDGQRLQNSYLGFFDLSNIPIAAVERIEILPTGASAVYGADALAGAVNTILRKDFTGLDITATLDQAPGVDDPGMGIAWGKKWDRGSVSFFANYEVYGELLGAQREPTSSTSLPAGVPPLALESDTCAPGNVYSANGGNLPGLNSSQAGIPAGVIGVPTISQFIPTAGRLNLCNPGRFEDITPASHREGALLSAHYELSASADVFTETLFSHKTLRYQIGPEVSASATYDGQLAASNPYNPFGQDVNVSFAYPGTGLVEDNSALFVRPLIGVRGSVFSAWQYEATATFSHDRLNDLSGSSNPAAISSALASSDPATALNPFTSGAPGTPQLLQSLSTDAAYVSDDHMLTGQALLRGPLISLPSGKVEAVIGGEFGREEQNTTDASEDIFLNLKRNTYAGFGEARIPLLGNGGSLPNDERLTLSLAGRYDHSNDYGGKATWQGGLQWRATDTVTFNGSYGQSYEAPQLSQISGPIFSLTDQFYLNDPFRGNQLMTYNTTIVFGPNPNLKPETGSSSSLQIAYSTPDRSGLRASLTWYELNISNYIGVPNPQSVIDNPSLFPGVVVRAPPTPADTSMGWLGIITEYFDSYENFGNIEVAGVDADLGYAIETPLGEFTPSLAIANIYRWLAALTPDAPPIDGVNKATDDHVGWSPRWKGTAALGWRRAGISASIDGRYIGPYLDYQDSVPGNNHEIGNSWVFDANLRVELGSTFATNTPWLRNSFISIGAVNVFNRIPPLSLTPGLYDFQEYDIRGRYLHLSVGVQF
jgi:iron complex outermembrane recepter protein